MVIKKQYFIPSLMIIELFFLFLYFSFNNEGLPLIRHLKNEQVQLRTQINNLQADISRLHITIDSWKITSFYKEKIAREQLQMACIDDIIFYMPEGNTQ